MKKHGRSQQKRKDIEKREKKKNAYNKRLYSAREKENESAIITGYNTVLFFGGGFFLFFFCLFLRQS